MLAVLCRHRDVFLVNHVRRGDIHHVNVRVLHHFLVAAVRLAAVHVGKTFCALNRAGADGRDVTIVQQRDALRKVLRNTAGGDEAPADFSFVIGFII